MIVAETTVAGRSISPSFGRFADAITDYDVAIEAEPDFTRTREDRERAGAGQPPVR